MQPTHVVVQYIAARRREGGICTTDTPTAAKYARMRIRQEIFFASAAPETVLALHFRPQRKKTLTPLYIAKVKVLYLSFLLLKQLAAEKGLKKTTRTQGIATHVLKLTV